jgi:hypothetical protein
MEDQQHATPNDNMEQGSNSQTTIEDLRRLTQAPSTQPLMTEAEFSVEAARSARPRWTQPLPKFALVGAILFPVFGLVCWFVLGGGNRYQQAEPAHDSDVARTQAQPTEEMAKLQAENAKLKTGMALNDQVAIEEQMRRTRAQAKTPKMTTQKQSSAKSRPASAQVSSVAPSRPVATYSAPQLPRSRTESLPVPTAISRPASAPSRPVDPMQQWQQLAQLGSYGSVRPERMAPEFSSSNQKPETSASANITSSVPTARIAPTSAVQPFSSEKTSRTFEQESVYPEVSHLISESSSDEVLSDFLERSEQYPNHSPQIQQQEQLTQSNRPILQDAETAILEGDSTPPSLIVGASTAGVLITPIVVDRASRSDQFVAILSEPLTDSRGRIAFPAGAQLLFQVDRLSETGQIHLSATTATWEKEGHQQELMLPKDAIQVRGEAGEPLIAEHYQDRGDEIAGMDAGQFLLGAISRAAGLYTRSDTRVQSRGSSTVITEENPEPNIVAGLLEGGTDAILETIQERNQRAVERLEEMPNARFIEAGTAVEIFVNQSMFMPM